MISVSRQKPYKDLTMKNQEDFDPRRKYGELKLKSLRTEDEVRDIQAKLHQIEKKLAGQVKEMESVKESIDRIPGRHTQ